MAGFMMMYVDANSLGKRNFIHTGGRSMVQMLPQEPH
jgi:hypothetical protein